MTNSNDLTNMKSEMNQVLKKFFKDHPMYGVWWLVGAILLGLFGHVASYIEIRNEFDKWDTSSRESVREDLVRTNGKASEYSILDWFDHVYDQTDEETLSDWYWSLKEATFSYGIYDEKAKYMYTKCIGLLPDFPAGYLGLAYWHHNKAQELSQDPGYWATSIDHAEKAVEFYQETLKAADRFFETYTFDLKDQEKAVYIGEIKRKGLPVDAVLPGNGDSAMMLISKTKLEELCVLLTIRCRSIIESQKEKGGVK